jgi:hypothetical protein
MENNQSATLTDASQLNAAGGGDNVSEETISLHELVNKELGTSYNDDDAALQGLKQTKDYVGRVGQVMPYFDKVREKGIPTNQLFKAMDTVVNGNPAGSPVGADTDKVAIQQELRSIRRDAFYAKNPDLEAYASTIDEVVNSTGKSYQEVVGSDSFKGIIEKAKGFDEIQKAKSVLQTNPRIGVAQDSLTKAQESMKQGDQAGAVANAMNAVMEATYGHK